MDLLEAIEKRHAVRSYTDKKIEGDVLKEIQKVIEECSAESKLNIQLILDEPKAFQSMMARLGKFQNVKNYIAIVGKKESDLEEKAGYYGQRIVLRATQLGLNTCWVALTYGKGKCPAVIGPGEKLEIVITIGYGATDGKSHKVKSIEELSRVEGSMPDWFKKGMEAAQLAPTATNQQKFCLELQGNTVKASPGSGPYSKLDLGIVKYHFELGAGEGEWAWG